MKRYFLTGLVTLLPLAVTIWVVHFVIRFFTQPFLGIANGLADYLPLDSLSFISKDLFLKIVSPLFILICLFLLMFFLGAVARRFFFNRMLKLGEGILAKIPLVNKVYKTSKEIVKSFFGSKAGTFQQVVMICFPYPGCYCIGLIAREAPQTCSKAEGEELVSVFVPTTPNPTTGFLVMSRKSELIFLDMKNEEAIKYIVSCAVIQPETKKNSV